MALEELPVPEPADDEVLIRVHAVSVNRTVDCAARAGTYSPPIRLPFIPGVDPSGIVVRAGAGVQGLREGDRVTAKLDLRVEGRPYRDRAEGSIARGGYAEYACAPAGRTALVPKSLPFAEATVVGRHGPLAFILLRNRAALKAGEWVLVMGAAGGLGSAGVQVARHLGAKVIAAAGSDERVRVGLDLGAVAGVNYRREDLTDAVMRITEGRGVDVVYENIGDPELFPRAFATLARGGRLVTAGGHGGGVVPLDVHRLYQNHITIRGASGTTPEDLALSLQAAAAGEFKVVVDRVMPLHEAAAAHELVEGRRALGKIVLDPTLEPTRGRTP